MGISLDKVFKITRGFQGRRKNCRRIAIGAAQKSLLNAYIGRKLRPRNIRKSQLTTIRAGAREYGLNYHQFIYGIRKIKSKLTHPMLANLARTEPNYFRNFTYLTKATIFPEKTTPDEYRYLYESSPSIYNSWAYLQSISESRLLNFQNALLIDKTGSGSVPTESELAKLRKITLQSMRKSLSIELQVPDKTPIATAKQGYICSAIVNEVKPQKYQPKSNKPPFFVRYSTTGNYTKHYRK